MRTSKWLVAATRTAQWWLPISLLVFAAIAAFMAWQLARETQTVKATLAQLSTTEAAPRASPSGRMTCDTAPNDKGSLDMLLRGLPASGVKISAISMSEVNSNTGTGWNIELQASYPDLKAWLDGLYLATTRVAVTSLELRRPATTAREQPAPVLDANLRLQFVPAAACLAIHRRTEGASR